MAPGAPESVTLPKPDIKSAAPAAMPDLVATRLDVAAPRVAIQDLRNANFDLDNMTVAPKPDVAVTVNKPDIATVNVEPKVVATPEAPAKPASPEMKTLETKAAAGTATLTEIKKLRDMQTEQSAQKEKANLMTEKKTLGAKLAEGKITDEEYAKLEQISDELDPTDNRTPEQKLEQEMDELSAKVIDQGEFKPEDLTNFMEKQAQFGTKANEKIIKSMNQEFIKKLFSKDTLDKLLATDKPYKHTQETLAMLQRFAALSKAEEIFSAAISNTIDAVTAARSAAEAAHGDLEANRSDENHSRVIQADSRLALLNDQLTQQLDRFKNIQPEYEQVSKDILIRLGFANPNMISMLLTNVRALIARGNTELQVSIKGTAGSYKEAKRTFKK